MEGEPVSTPMTRRPNASAPARESRLARAPNPLARANAADGADEDGWVDVVADEMTRILKDDGLQLELLVFYDPITECLHAVGYDGAPGRYLRSLDAVAEAPRPPPTPLVPTPPVGPSPSPPAPCVALALRTPPTISPPPDPAVREPSPTGELPMTALAGSPSRPASEERSGPGKT